MAEEEQNLSAPRAAEQRCADANALAPPKTYELQVARWEGRIRCVYLNDFRIAGGKPWGGYEPAATWQITMSDIEGAIPEVAKVRHDRDALLLALQEMEAEKSDYMRINNLGDPANEHTNKLARAAIAQATGEGRDNG